jgi:hypothetical protein
LEGDLVAGLGIGSRCSRLGDTMNMFLLAGDLVAELDGLATKQYLDAPLPGLLGYTDGWRDIILGYGATWEEAFRLADPTPIDTSEEGWWGPDPNGIQQRHAAWCSGGAECTCSSIRRAA